MANSALRQTGCLALAMGLFGVDALGQGGLAVTELGEFPVIAGTEWESQVTRSGQLVESLGHVARIELQSRGGMRYQTDILIRGGIFEGSGLAVGGMTLLDPQTGHYAAEVPLDSGFFSGAELVTGAAGSLNNFQATAGAIDWHWRPVDGGGEASSWLGTDGWFGGRVRSGHVWGNGLALEVGIGAESGDGSVENGDFDIRRISGRMEGKLGGGTWRLFGGYMEKFYGWPGMYTGRPGLNETEDYQVTLLGWQWESAGEDERDRHRVGGYWRRLDDDYEFSREAPNAFFEHLTEVWSLQGDGGWRWDDWGIRYQWLYLEDQVVRSTSLTNGRFMDRNYGKLAAQVERSYERGGLDWTGYAGMAMDSSNRDSTVGLPFGGVRFEPVAEGGNLGSWEGYFEYATASRVPGYTVLNSAPTGLFGGNAALGREFSRTIEAGWRRVANGWRVEAALFHRWDDDLVDWVFDQNTPNARRAAAVDLEVSGLEIAVGRVGPNWSWDLHYAWTDKQADYPDGGGNASFYALNYAGQRLLGNVQVAAPGGTALRVEAEVRRFAPNALRGGDRTVAVWNVEWNLDALLPGQFGMVVRIDNLTDERVEFLPGTPGPGREARLILRATW